MTGAAGALPGATVPLGTSRTTGPLTAGNSAFSAGPAGVTLLGARRAIGGT
jgi:hypothetical protein